MSNRLFKRISLLLLAALMLFTTSCGFFVVSGTDIDTDISSESIKSSDDINDDSGQDPGDTADDRTAADENAGYLPVEGAYYYDVVNVVLYLDTYGKLPPNYITKDEARDLGWNGGSVDDYLEGAAIGGDTFQNREELLPIENGRKYTECDIDTLGEDSRGAKRLVFSNDGLYFYSEDHYLSFKEIIIDGGEVTFSD